MHKTFEPEAIRAADHHPPDRQAPAAPNIFLMTNSLERGGSERQFVSLAQNLDPHAFSVHLGCLAEKGPFREELGHMEIFPLAGSFYTAQSFRARWQLARYLRRTAIDVAHAFDFYTNLVLIPVAKLARVPVVIGSQRQIGDLLTPAQWRAQIWTFRLCDKVICNSRAAADRLCQQGLRRDKVAVIENGLPAAVFAETSPALPPVHGLLRIGMLARMNHRTKNHNVLLRAAALTLCKLPNVEFVLVGDGPLRPELEQQAAALGIADRVRFLGDRRDIPAVLASLDITVLPSTSESLSNSIIESMAAGVPVIATRVGGNTELVANDTGLLVPEGDDQALASAMESLLSHESLRKRLGRNARNSARERFTIERMCQNHEKLYAELLQSKRGARTR